MVAGLARNGVIGNVDGLVKTLLRGLVGVAGMTVADVLNFSNMSKRSGSMSGKPSEPLSRPANCSAGDGGWVATGWPAGASKMG